MTTKTTDSAERLKALMRQHTATMTPPVPHPIAAPAEPPSSPAGLAAPTRAAWPSRVPEMQEPIWNRITLRLTAGEAGKINDVVIATQQANRWAKVTATDVMRLALRRIKENEALDANDLKTLRARSRRLASDS